MKSRLLYGFVVLFVAVGAVGVRADEEQDQIAVLQSQADAVQKCNACLRLRVVGTARAVPALEALLGEERVSHAARHALEGMPCTEAGQALRRGLGETSGLNKAGIVDSLGWRGESQAVPLLVPLLSDRDTLIASAAAAALGRIGGQEAIAALRASRDKAPAAVQPAIFEGLLQCAEVLRGSGDNAAAAAVYRDLLNERSSASVRAAAWRGVVLCEPARRADLMIEALRGKDASTRQAASKLIRELGDAPVVRACARQWDALPAESQRAVLDAHVTLGMEAIPTIRAAIASDNETVRIAALEAAGCAGGADLVGILAARAAKGSDDERTAARQGLGRLSGDDVDKALLTALDSAEPSVRVELIDALRRRGAAIATDQLMKQARSDVPQVRRAALAALGEVAGPEQVPDLVGLLAEQAGGDQADDAVKALVALARRTSTQDQAAQLVVARLSEAAGPTRTALLHALGQLGSARGEAALRDVLKQNDDAGLREAALRALAAWPNDAFVPDLLNVARTSDRPVHRVLAARAAVDLVDRSKASADTKVGQLRQIMQAAQRPGEKRAALAVLAKIHTAGALELACEVVADASVRAEAAQAALQIAQAIAKTEPKAVAAAMRKVAAAPVADEQKQQAESLLLEIESVQSYLTQWEVAGPYMQEGRNYAALFDIPFPPEQPGAEVEWKPIAVEPLDNHPAYVDLLKAFGGEQRVAYLRTTIESEASQPARLELYTDDGVKAWLNGTLVHANNTARPIMPQPDTVNVTLQQGTNVLLLKITQNNLPWGAIVRLRRARGIDGPVVGEGFRLHVINAESRFEAGTIMDVNRDGKSDILCGGFWYEAPTWEKHVVREIREEGGYHYDFANLPMDVDGNGWVDTVGAAWHNKMVYWVRNPGKTGEPWPVFEIDTPGNMETAITADINGDGQPDILPNIMSAAAWYEFKRDPAAPNGVRWIKHDLPQAAAGHGIGAGDVNGDGRCDVVAPNGWLEQMADGSWTWHAEFQLGTTSIPILVHDVDGDGDSDILWGLGHDYGIYWLEQGRDPNGQRTWARHLIDDSWSQPHFPLLADLDGDGADDLVVGKRYHAHNGHDPGGNDPVCVYYYTFDRGAKRWTRHVIHEGGRVGFGINTVAEDIDGDGDLDVLAPGKSGLYLLENLRR